MSPERPHRHLRSVHPLAGLGRTCSRAGAASHRGRVVRLMGLLRGPLAITLGSSVLIQACGVVTGIVLARSLGAVDRGALGIVLLWPGVVAAFAIMGLPDAVSVQVASRAMGRRAAARTGTAIGLLLAGLGVLVALPIQLGLSGSLGPDSRFGGVVYLAFIPLNIATLVMVAALGGSRLFGAMNAVRISVVIVALVCLPLLAYLHVLTVLTAVLVYLAANMVALALSIATQVGRSDPLPARASFGLARRLLSFGVRSHVGSVANTLNQQLDQMVISVALPPRELGLYLVAVTLASGTNVISSSVSAMVLPNVAGLALGARVPALQRYLQITLVLCLLIAAGLFVVVPFILSQLFGAEFIAASTPARILLVASLPLSVSRALSASTRACGYPGSASRAEILGMGVIVPAYALLIPKFGISGAAAASLIGYGASAWFQMLAARRALGAHSIFDLIWTPAPGTGPT